MYLSNQACKVYVLSSKDSPHPPPRCGSQPHKWFLAGCSPPLMRLAEHVTALRASCTRCLPGRWKPDVFRLGICMGARVCGLRLCMSMPPRPLADRLEANRPLPRTLLSLLRCTRCLTLSVQLLYPSVPFEHERAPPLPPSTLDLLVSFA